MCASPQPRTPYPRSARAAEACHSPLTIESLPPGLFSISWPLSPAPISSAADLHSHPATLTLAISPFLDRAGRSACLSYSQVYPEPENNASGFSRHSLEVLLQPLASALSMSLCHLPGLIDSRPQPVRGLWTAGEEPQTFCSLT